MTKDIFSVPELVIAQDSVTSGVDEHRRRFEASIKEKKKPTPAKQAEHEVVHGKQNKEVVSKTSPGPGWTKTKGTNIWAPPKGKMMAKMTRTLKPIKSTTSNKSMVSRQQRKEKSPAKIAPLVLMGAQMLGKKMMEKKQEKDSPATQKSPAKAKKAKKESTAMSNKIKEVSTANYNETNKALEKAGKPTITRAEYNKSLGRSKESSI